MRLCELYRKNRPAVSFEVFPPKTPEGDVSLRKTLEALARFQPAFVSCTYGAGGGTRNRTLDWCVEIQNQFSLLPVAHFTCAGAAQEQLVEWLAEANSIGIQNIMALRGDPPQGHPPFEPIPGGFRYAYELVTLIRKQYPTIGIGVAGYPEKHPEAQDFDSDLKHLKQKVEAGADAVFTQLFYENSHFFRFRDRCDRMKLEVPVIPGIMPVTDYDRIKRISALCGTQFPNTLAQRLEAMKNNTEAQLEIGVEHAIEQCQDLIEQGVPGVHFFVLNKSRAVQKILAALVSLRS